MRRTAALAAMLLSGALLVPNVAFADATITAAGSTALLPLVKEAATLYQQANPDVKINVSGGGSGVGITQVASKAVDIGDSDILATGQPDLIDHAVAVIGFSVIVNPATNVKALTKAQIQAIFTGKTTNWKDVGGADQKIVFINRPRSSGTRAVFVKTIMGGTPVSEAGLVEDATGTVVTTVKNTPGSVSYAAFSGTRGASGVTEVSIDGVAPTDDNVVAGKYPFWSYEHMYTNGPPSKDVSRFLAFVTTRRDLLGKLGYIPINDMKVKESDR